jgi:hypothetical protein
MVLPPTDEATLTSGASATGPVDEVSATILKLAAKPDEHRPSSYLKHIDLDKLRIDPDGADMPGTEVVATTVHLGKPKGDWFSQVLVGWVFLAFLYKDESDHGHEYLVMPHLATIIGDRIRPVTVVFACNLTGEFYFWPLPRPDAGGRPNAWHESARAAANEAKTSWVRMSADMAAGRYRVLRATGNHPAPKWPATKEEIDKLFMIAVAANIIDSVDHPIVVRLLGA